MEKIYIGFSKRNNNIVSKSIQIAEGSEFSHVYIRRVSKYGEYVYQASGLAVNFTNIDIFKEHNIIVEEYEFELPEEKRDRLISFFIKYAGAEYATLDLFKILYILCVNRIGASPNINGDGEKSFICSELGALICKEMLEIPMPDSVDFITPAQLNPIIKKYGKRII